MLLIFLTLFQNFPLSAPLQLKEESLIELAKRSNPTRDEIQIATLQKQLQSLQFYDEFNPTLESSGSYLVTKEEPFNAFIPINTPVKALEATVSKSYQNGIQIQAFSELSQVTNNFFKDGTTFTVGARANFDIYQELIKKKSRLRQTFFDGQKGRAKIEKEISLQEFYVNLRKVYWNLVALNERKLLTEKLLVQAKQQVRNAKKRFRNGVSDRGEVARYQAQRTSRKASIESLNFQSSSYLGQLKELLPGLNKSQNITLAPYNLDTTLKETLQCLALINQKSDAPLEFTQYDELVSELNQELIQETKLNQNYSRLGLKGFVEVRGTARDFGYSEVFDDYSDNNKLGQSVGLNLSVPLGSRKKNSQEVLQEITKKRYHAQAEGRLAKLNSFHQTIVQTSQQLYRILKTQKENTGYLKTSLNESQKKFRQARISVEQLVNEQDLLLQSELNVITTKLNVMLVILDYFSVFNQTPCPLNITAVKGS